MNPDRYYYEPVDRDWIPEPHIDPLARYASADIDAFALVGAFRWGGNRAAAKALGDIIERRVWKGVPPVVLFAELLNTEEARATARQDQGGPVSHDEAVPVNADPNTPPDPYDPEIPSRPDWIVLAFPMPDQFCADVMCTALEGGIGYWCCAGDIAKRECDGSPGQCYLSFAAFDAEDGDLPLGTVTYDTIRKGVEFLLSGRVKANKHITGWILEDLIAGGKAGSIDSDCADAIVQAGLLNELRFG